MIRRVIIFLILVAGLGWGQQKRPFTFEDMMALKRVGEPAVSPNGKWVAFSVVDVNLKANTKTPSIYVVSINGGEARQLTKGEGEDRPRWSPDGRQLAMVLTRGGEPQIWVSDIDPETAMPLPGKPLRQITTISTGASGEIWSPGGKYILFTSDVFPDCPDDACNQQRDEQQAQSKVKATVFRGLFFRHWSNYTGDKRTHIFVQPAAGGVPKDLTPGDHDAPPFSLGGQDMYAFSPDSQEVAFTSNIDEVEAISTNNEIFIVPVAGGTPKKISTSPGSDSTPLYSPDGKYIAWRMQETPGYESDRFRLVIYERATGKITNVTENFDRWVGSFVWAGHEIFFTAEDQGESPIYGITPEICLERCHPIKLIDGHNDDLAVVHKKTILNDRGSTSEEDTIVFSRTSVRAPGEIFIGERKPHGCAIGLEKIKAMLLGEFKEPLPECAQPNARQITHLNDAVLSQISMQPLEPFWFTGEANVKVQGFLVKPPNFDAAKKYPVKFLIHGGPEGAWGDSWSYRWNAELMAASGYVVVMINFTGSTGYGQKFTQAIQGDWGGRPYEDLMRGLDYVEKTYPFVDKDRECALGASFGGYMANWILGHTTRFKCIVSHDGIFNAESAYGTTEELWFPEWEFKGTPWTNRTMYDKWSPHLFATNFKTPTLVVHGQRDYRLDVSQGFDLFTTLQRLKVPSKMLYFPDEGHWVLKPQNSQLWWKTVNEWVDQWTSKK
jgi:dipeptidyl aminopeptidase/acylaminoacyl peptidase